MATPTRNNSTLPMRPLVMRKPVATPQAAPQNTQGLVQRAQAGRQALTSRDVVSLQQSVGNQTVQRLLNTSEPSAQPPSPLIQPKLKVGPANDHYEQEADRVASSVMRQFNAQAGMQRSHGQTKVGQEGESLQRSITPINSQRVSRKADENAQPRASSGPTSGPTIGLAGGGLAGGAIDSHMESSIQRQRGGGRPLDDSTRSQMESAFGADFSGVKIHTNTQADQLNRSINADAFTTGQDLFFRSGSYNPHSNAGQKLLAHELTHVVQQTGGQNAGPAQGQVNRKIDKTSAPVIQRVLRVGGDIYDDEDIDDLQDEEHMVSPEEQSMQDVNNSDYNYVMGGKNITYSTENWRKVKTNLEGYDSLKWGEKRAMKKRFKKWIEREATVDHTKGKKLLGGITTEMVKIGMGKKSEDRRYKDWKSVGTALLGEQRAKKNKGKEQDLAKKVSKQKDFRTDLVSVLQTLYRWIEAEIIPDEPDFWKDIQAAKGKKFRWVYGNANMKARLQTPAANKVSSNFAIFHDVMFYAGRAASKETTRKSDIFGVNRGAPEKRSHIHMPGESPTVGFVGAGAFEKGGQHSMIEDNSWVKAARARNMPVGAGASNTTYALMNFAQSIGLDGKQKEALAWAAFIYWNKKAKQVEARAHTFHEVMDVANLSSDGEVRYDVDSSNPYNVGYGAKSKTDRTWRAPTSKVERDFPLSGFTLSAQVLGNMRRGLFSFNGLSLEEMESMTQRDIFLLAAELNKTPKLVFNAHAQELKRLRQEASKKKDKNKKVGGSSSIKVEKQVGKHDEGETQDKGKQPSLRIVEKEDESVKLPTTVEDIDIESPSTMLPTPEGIDDDLISEGEGRTLTAKEVVTTLRPFKAIDRRNKSVIVPAESKVMIISVGLDEIEFEAALKGGNMSTNIRGTALPKDITGAL